MCEIFQLSFSSFFLKVSLSGHVPSSAKPKEKGKKHWIREVLPGNDKEDKETFKGSQLNLIRFTKSLPSKSGGWLDMVFPPSKWNV
jgi:hypothetical protein